MPHLIEDPPYARLSIQHASEIKPLWEDAREPSELGLAGDGIQDDTARMQALLNTDADLYLPPGNYRITQGSNDAAALTFPGNDRVLRGSPLGTTIIEFELTGDRNDGLLADTLSNIKIEDVTFATSANAQNVGELNHIVRFHDCSGVDLLRTNITGPGIGTNVLNKQTRCMTVDGCEDFTMVGCFLQYASSETNLYLTGCKTFQMMDCTCNNAGTHGMQIFSNTERLSFDGCRFNGNGRVYPDLGSGGGSGVRITGHECIFFGCVALNNYGPGYEVWTDNAGSSPSYDTKFIACDGSQQATGGGSNYAGFRINDESGNNAPMITRTGMHGCVVRDTPGNGFTVGTGLHTVLSACNASQNGLSGFEFHEAIGMTALANAVTCLVAAENSQATPGSSYGVSLKGRNFLTGNIHVVGYDPTNHASADETTWQASATQNGAQVNEQSGVMVDALMDGFHSHVPHTDDWVYNGTDDVNLFALTGAGVGAGFQGSRYGATAGPSQPAFFADAICWYKADDVNADGGVTQPAEGTALEWLYDQQNSYDGQQTAGTRRGVLNKQDDLWTLDMLPDATERREWRTSFWSELLGSGAKSMIIVGEVSTENGWLIASATQSNNGTGTAGSTFWLAQRPTVGTGVTNEARFENIAILNLRQFHCGVLPANSVPTGFKYYNNGQPQTASATYGTTAINTADQNGYSSVFGYGFNQNEGKWNEMLVFDRELTQQEIDDAQTWFSSKWLLD